MNDANRDAELAALLSDAHFATFRDDIPFWLALANKTGSPVLELGCGGGRVMLELARAGFRTVGIDSDPFALDLLRTRFLQFPPQRWSALLADMTDFPSSESFALIYSPCNTYSTLDAVSRRRLLAHISKFIRPAGVFAVALPNPLALLEVDGGEDEEVEDVFDHPLTHDPVEVSSSFWHEDGKFCLAWHYNTLLPGGEIKRVSLLTRHSLDPLETYLAELHAAGFVVSDVLGDYDASPYSPDSPGLIFIAHLTS